MTVYTESLASAENTTMMNVSAAGLQKSLLELLRQATLKRLSRIVTVRKSNQVRSAVHHWHTVSKCEQLHEHHQGVQEKVSKSHIILHEEQEKKIAEIRRDWKTSRARLVQEIGYVQEDHVAVSPDDIDRLRQLDRSFRERLNEVQQDHLQHSDILAGHCQKLQKQSGTKLQAMALLALGAKIEGGTSKSALGRTWQLTDMDTSVLQWAFTHAPDPTMVPFPQTVAMEDQQETLSQTCRLILEYADKLPRWGQLASANQGRLPANRPSAAAAHLLKSVLRRLQAKCSLQPAFQRLMDLAPHHPGRGSALARKGWEKARSAVKKKRDLDKQEQNVKTARDANRRKSMHVTNMGGSDHKRRAQTMGHADFKEHAEDSHDSASPDRNLETGSSWDYVLQNTNRRLSRPAGAAPFQLGDEPEDAVTRQASLTTVTPRLRAKTEPVSMPGAEQSKSSLTPNHGSPDVLNWAGETPAAASAHKSAATPQGPNASRSVRAAAVEEDSTSVSGSEVYQMEKSASTKSLRDAQLPPMPVVAAASATHRDGSTQSEGSIPDDLPVHEAPRTAVAAGAASARTAAAAASSSSDDSTSESGDEV